MFAWVAQEDVRESDTAVHGGEIFARGVISSPVSSRTTADWDQFFHNPFQGWKPSFSRSEYHTPDQAVELYSPRLRLARHFSDTHRPQDTGPQPVA